MFGTILFFFNRNTNFVLTTLFIKSVLLGDNTEKFCTAGQATYYNIARRMSFVRWATKATNTHQEYTIFTACPR